MPKGNPPEFGPKSGCRSRPAAPMLRSQAALWAFTGNWEMSVFQTLLAGNIGQFGAPGTVVPAPLGLAACAGGMAARPVPVPATGAWASLAARTVPGEAPEPCRRPVPVPAPAAGAAVPQAARNASAARVVRIRTGVVRSGLPTGLILPRQAQQGAACCVYRGQARAGRREPARARLAEPRRLPVTSGRGGRATRKAG